MLNWIIETTRGDFEGVTQEQVIQKMISHYAKNDRDPKQITKISACDDLGEITQQVSEDEIGKIQDRVEEEVREWREKVEEEAEGLREIQNDYFLLRV